MQQITSFDKKTFGVHVLMFAKGQLKNSMFIKHFIIIEFDRGFDWVEVSSFSVQIAHAFFAKRKPKSPQNWCIILYFLLNKLAEFAVRSHTLNQMMGAAF